MDRIGIVYGDGGVFCCVRNDNTTTINTIVTNARGGGIISTTAVCTTSGSRIAYSVVVRVIYTVPPI